MNDINYQNNNEIDLIELIKALWNKKIWILLSAFFVPLLRVFTHLQQKSSGPQQLLLLHHVQLI